jgi:hypothetical protein
MKVESNINTSTGVSAYQALLRPLELLHHKGKAVKYSFIKAGTSLLTTVNLVHTLSKTFTPWMFFEDKVWVLMATIRRGLASAMSLAQTARELQCRSQAIMPRLSGRAARWFTKTVAS